MRQVVRVGQGGVAEFVGPTPPGMASVNAVVGDVFNQRLYLWNNAGGGTLAIVNLVTNTLETTLTTSGVSSMNDWAFSSTDGNLYYVRNSDGAVVRVNPTTGVGTVVPGVTVPTGATFGAQYSTTKARCTPHATMAGFSASAMPRAAARRASNC